MSWRWQLNGSADQVVASEHMSPAQTFPNRSEAETWIGEVWRDLLETGVESVTLFEDGRQVYGPMSLRP